MGLGLSAAVEVCEVCVLVRKGAVEVSSFWGFWISSSVVRVD